MRIGGVDELEDNMLLTFLDRRGTGVPWRGGSVALLSEMSVGCWRMRLDEGVLRERSRTVAGRVLVVLSATIRSSGSVRRFVL